MLRTPHRLALGLSLLAVVACDQRTDEELRAMIGDVVATQLEPIKTKQDEASKALETQDEVLKEQADKIKALERRVEETTAQMVALESQLAEAETSIEEIEAKVAPPKPSGIPGRPDPAATYKVEVGDAQAIGPDTALVTIVTWSDFQCPFCKRVAPTVDQLRKDYGADLRVVFKHNPLSFHTSARPAAIAAEAAGKQGKFWEMHDKLFENNRDLSEKNFISWAKELGLDVKQFKRDLDDPTIARRVDNQQAEGNRLGARGTPAFFVNGRFLSGAQPIASFKKLIDQERGKAEAKVAAGTPRARVYEETIAGGKTTP